MLKLICLILWYIELTGLVTLIWTMISVKNWKGIIVKFNTSRHRTMLYKARSKLIRLKGWPNLLIKTTDFVKVIQTIKFWDVGTKLQWFNNKYKKKKKYFLLISKWALWHCCYENLKWMLNFLNGMYAMLYRQWLLFVNS